MAAHYLSILSADQLRGAIRRVFASKGEKIVEMNLAAFEVGYNAINQ
jgi:indolepyruvate ferredoxin oxidoreductase beta subunit